MKIAELLGTAALVRGGARASRAVSQSLVDGLGRFAADRVRPDMSEAGLPPQHVYSGSLLAPLPIRDAMDRFMAFAEDRLCRWQKLAAITTPDGIAVATYSGKFSPRMPLQARSYWARLAEDEHRRRGRGGSRIEARVVYRYQVTFELRAVGPRQTMISFRTLEIVDPEFASGYDLQRHFAVPSMPAGFGRVGEQFLDSVSR